LLTLDRAEELWLAPPAAPIIFIFLCLPDGWKSDASSLAAGWKRAIGRKSANRFTMTPEEKARAKIDAMLLASGWAVQTRDQLNLSAPHGVAVCELSFATGEPRI